MSAKYYLTVGCIFKNESQSICEWIHYYLSVGVDHIYLINDSSTDDSINKINSYIESNKVTLFNSKYPYYLGRQRDMLTEFLMPKFNSNEAEWLIICDMDEYLWSPDYSNLKDAFKRIEHLGQVQFQHTLFGSNGHIEQPESVLKGFTKRSIENPTFKPNGNYKYAIHNTHKFEKLNIHHATFKNKEDENPNTFQIIGHPCFQLNHYCCQSLEFWKNIKCTRGDCDNYRIRTMDEFNKYDINEVEDTGILQRDYMLYI